MKIQPGKPLTQSFQKATPTPFKGQIRSPLSCDTVSFSGKQTSHAKPKRLAALAIGLTAALSACGGGNDSAPNQQVPQNFAACFGPEAQTSVSQSTHVTCNPLQAIDEQLIKAIDNKKYNAIVDILQFIQTQPEDILSAQDKLHYGIWAFDGAPQNASIENAGLNLLQSLLDNPAVDDAVKTQIIQLKENAPYTSSWSSLRWHKGHEDSWDVWVGEDCWTDTIEEYNYETEQWEYAGTEEYCEDIYETEYEWQPGYFVSDSWTTREYPEGYPNAVTELYDEIAPQRGGPR